MLATSRAVWIYEAGVHYHSHTGCYDIDLCAALHQWLPSNVQLVSSSNQWQMASCVRVACIVMSSVACSRKVCNC